MITDFKERVASVDPRFLCFDKLETLQVNLGDMCNQCCQHCHIEADPAGNKVMRRDVMEKIINFLRNQEGITLDLTGGCPELHPDFKFFVEETRELTSRLMVRTNLTVLLEEGKDWIPQWYKDNQVVVIASMPCYTKENVDKQRGDGVYEKSIEVLKKLNELGYGDSLELNLVYNPGGDFLPAFQKELEMDYKRELSQNYGLRFHSLFTITNAPIGRFKNYLKANGLLEQYNQLLADSFNPDAAKDIMCRTLISVDWQGILYNCDFNQALGLPVRNEDKKILEIDDIQHAIQSGTEIVVAEHCYCCTAGAGSSCTGTLV
ncbi:arsenosugar biosynthesis radical SAM (seleno)protein ArsS [Chloroflexota bacterium]